MSAIAEWATAGVIRAPASGVVTSVDVDLFAPVSEGDRLATVNLIPTFAAIGTVPAFRELTVGSRGPDVAQLETFLARAGHDPGSRDDLFSDSTTRAVRSWQLATGAPITGSVALGSVVFVPSLPAPIRPVIAVGDSINVGDPLLEIVEAFPEFNVGVTEEQVALIPPAAEVRVTYPDGQWSASAGEIVTIEGDPVLHLDGVDGQPVCASSCSIVSLSGKSSWQATIIVVPEVTGAVVPVGAIRTGPDGERFVVTSLDQQVSIQVLASADGQAVVDGVAVGDRVLLPTELP